MKKQKTKMKSRMKKRRLRILKAEHFARWIASLPSRNAAMACGLQGMRVAVEKTETEDERLAKKVELIRLKVEMMKHWTEAVVIMGKPTKIMDML